MGGADVCFQYAGNRCRCRIKQPIDFVLGANRTSVRVKYLLGLVEDEQAAVLILSLLWLSLLPQVLWAVVGALVSSHTMQSY